MYLEKFKLTDRVAVVTGGARGIGLATAEALAEAGARVTITDRDEAALGGAAAALGAKGYRIEAALMDVTDSKHVAVVADEIAAREGRIDILVNNAGIARSEVRAEDVADEHWLNVIDVNLNGSFWCARAFGRHMLAQGSGAIVNVGSMSGFVVNRPQPQSLLQRLQGGCASAHEVAGRRMGAARGAGQRGCAHLYQHAAERLRRSRGRNVQNAGSTARRWAGWASPRKWPP